MVNLTYAVGLEMGVELGMRKGIGIWPSSRGDLDVAFSRTHGE
jgi:hypothetical protein